MDTKPLLSHIELELQKQISRLDTPRTQAFHEMLTYHMGWTGEGAGPEATGKRIRPMLVFNPVMPHQAAGMRTEPPVSVPMAQGAMRAATATAEPAEEPPGVRATL